MPARSGAGPMTDHEFHHLVLQQLAELRKEIQTQESRITAWQVEAHREMATVSTKVDMLVAQLSDLRSSVADWKEEHSDQLKLLRLNQAQVEARHQGQVEAKQEEEEDVAKKRANLGLIAALCASAVALWDSGVAGVQHVLDWLSR